MIYWVTQTIASSMRIYYEYNKNPWILQADEKITVPCVMGSFPGENTLREWAEQFYNIQHWTEFTQGGHFPAMEVPELLIADIRAAFKNLRNKKTN